MRFAPLTEAVVKGDRDADLVCISQQDAASNGVAVVQNVSVGQARALETKTNVQMAARRHQQ